MVNSGPLPAAITVKCSKWPHSGRVAEPLGSTMVHIWSALWMSWLKVAQTACFCLSTFNAGHSLTFFVVLEQWLLWKCLEMF